MTEKGWQVVEDPVQGGWGAPDGIPNEQFEQYEADQEECSARFGYDQIPPPSFTQAEAAELYDVLLEVADCLRASGFEVTDPPSEQQFVEDLVAHPIPAWHPYDVLYERGILADIQRAEAECPVPDF